MNCKMGSVLKFAVFFSICWLIPCAASHSDQDNDKRLNNEYSNQNVRGLKDFHFEKQKANGNNMKTGRAILQTAWSKEDKEQIQPVEDKTGDHLKDEFSFKSAFSSLLNMLQELKKEIFGIKKMAALKNAKDLTSLEDNIKQNKMEEESDSPESDSTIKNAEFEKKNQKPKSNYIINYYENSGYKYVNDDLETSSDESDDSSHEPNEGSGVHEISTNEDDACISECAEFKNHEGISSEAGKNAAIPKIQIKIPEESNKGLDNTKDNIKGDDLEKSTTKPSKMKNNSKATGAETENNSIAKTGKCVKMYNDNSKNLHQKPKPSEKVLKSAEVPTTRSPQNDNSNSAKSKLSNQDKNVGSISEVTPSSPDSKSSQKDSQNTGGSDLDNNSDVQRQTTTLSSQSSRDPDTLEEKPYASGMFSKKPIYKNQKEQSKSPKTKEQEQSRNDPKSLKNSESANENTTVSSQSPEPGSEMPEHETNTDSVIKDNPKKSKGKTSNIDSSPTFVTSENKPSLKNEPKTSNSLDTDNTISSTSIIDSSPTSGTSENKPSLKNDEPKNSNGLDTDNTISSTTPENILKTDNLNKNLPEHINGKKETNENKESNDTKQGKNDSEPQRDSETEQAKTQLSNNNSKPEKSLENNKLNNSNQEINNEEDGDNLKITTNDLTAPQNSNSEIQSRDVEGSDKVQDVQINKESANENDEIREISSDQEYEYEDDDKEFDNTDESTDLETDEDSDQNQEDELIIHNENGDNDEKNPINTTTVMTEESQISQNAGYMTEEKPQEQYNTFLEYFYKNSNNSFFQSLKKQSHDFSQ